MMTSDFFGQTGAWIVSSIQKTVQTENEQDAGTIVASFAGTLAEAESDSPALGSCSELLNDSRLRLNSITFSFENGIVTGTFSYRNDETDSTNSATYSLNAAPANISILSARRFASASKVEKEIARCYVAGWTDSTTVWRNKTGDTPELRDELPTEGEWEETTLGAVAEKYAAASTLVKYARAGKKTWQCNKLTWTETKTESSLPSISRLGDRSSPRGPNPSGYKWEIASVSATPAGTDDSGNSLWKNTTVWETVKDGEEDDE